MISNMLQRIGHRALSRLASLGRSGQLLFQALVARPQPLVMLPLLIKQLWFVGVLSLVIIVVSGGFIGMVLGLQGYTILVDYGSEQAVGQLVALSLARELAPVVTALLFAGRAGSALTAEIGLMKATEQLAGLEMIGVDPLRRIVAPRFWAGFICMPILTMIFTVVGIWGVPWSRWTGWGSMTAPSGPACSRRSAFMMISSTASSSRSALVWWSPGLPCFRGTTVSLPRKESVKPRPVPSCTRRWRCWGSISY